MKTLSPTSHSVLNTLSDLAAPEMEADEMVRVRKEIENCLEDAWEVARGGLAGSGDALTALSTVMRSFIERKSRRLLHV